MKSERPNCPQCSRPMNRVATVAGKGRFGCMSRECSNQKLYLRSGVQA